MMVSNTMSRELFSAAMLVLGSVVDVFCCSKGGMYEAFDHMSTIQHAKELQR